LYPVDHELRTPLSSITSYLYLLDHGKPEKREQYMTTLHRETALLQRLIEDLLDLSRLDQGRTRFDLAPVDVNRLVAMLVDARALMVSQRRLTLEVHTEPGLPAVLGDANMLMQVLTNLIANAVNYTPAGGVITISTALRNRYWVLGIEESDTQYPIPDTQVPWVTISVSDTGLGITPEDQAHIFERFYRGEAARQVGVAGTGLGLSICQEIVQRHNGKITVESGVGQGSTFTVWLPAGGEG
jgi:signal transduction histidine kinase